MVEPDTVHVRFLVLRELPLLVADLEGDPPALPLVEDNLLKRLTEAGLAMLPGFFGVELPRGARVGWTLETEELRLEDDEETALLRLPRGTVDPVWEAASLRLRGTMFCAGWNVGIDPDQSDQQTCERLEAAARREALAGAIVGVAEPATGLPLFG